jgi:uncharacterized protein YbcV (DUF1398 family)
VLQTAPNPFQRLPDGTADAHLGFLGNVAESSQENYIVNADVIRKMAEVTLSGSMPFPEIVQNLIKEGVEYYQVDYVSLSFSFYSASGGVVVAPLAFEGLPAVSTDFDAAELRAAILDSQQQGQKFRQFCARATKAGVQSYFAFLRGQRVLYLGRQGDQHVEWFPGAKRGDA